MTEESPFVWLYIHIAMLLQKLKLNNDRKEQKKKNTLLMTSSYNADDIYLHSLMFAIQMLADSFGYSIDWPADSWK